MKYSKRAFTLAEIMIVLAVIGVLSAILIPIARNSMPDENIMKFKKANKTLMNVIRELVTSDKYYLDGDLGLKADGTILDRSHKGDNEYFCQTFADIVSTKINNCANMDDVYTGHTHYWVKILQDDTIGLWDSETDTTTYT